ncbi:glycosyltransferase [uncultured Enterovirga sp.]|uniref:glycosyltransferase n=1 Tax=uncultured Enterovirga sp. TaxID=2026352 RepID=UPI0035CA59FA
MVIITMTRPAELARLLVAIGEQERRPDCLIVVENGRDAATAEVLRAHPMVQHLSNVGNLGGAGGFAYGILAALAQGASSVWVMDDDGLPEDNRCLAELVARAEKTSADIVSPLIVDINDSSKLSFPYYLGFKRLRCRRLVRAMPEIHGFAHLFNGALLSADACRRFGVPDFRLFIRGDEVDFLNRVRRGGGQILTLTNVGFRHPSGSSETEPILGGYLNAVLPKGDLKQFYFFRNRGYIVREHRLVLQFCSDLVRYPAYFLLKKRGDWRGLLRWIRLTVRGFRGDFTPFDPIADSTTSMDRRTEPLSSIP